MRCKFDILTFGNSEKTYRQHGNKIVETFDDNKNLIKRIEYDKFERDIDVKWYDNLKNIVAHMQKEYFETENEKGYIEIYKNNFQEYIRKSYTKIENGLKHAIDDFTSKTNPQNSYFNDFIYDSNGKLQKIVSLKK